MPTVDNKYKYDTDTYTDTDTDTDRHRHPYTQTDTLTCKERERLVYMCGYGCEIEVMVGKERKGSQDTPTV